MTGRALDGRGVLPATPGRSGCEVERQRIRRGIEVRGARQEGVERPSLRYALPFGFATWTTEGTVLGPVAYVDSASENPRVNEVESDQSVLLPQGQVAESLHDSASSAGAAHCSSARHD